MLSWNEEEIGAGCWFWPLTTVPGSGSDGLPIDEKKEDLYNLFSKRGSIVGLQGATGSGKSMRTPQYLLHVLKRCRKWWSRKHECVCLVQDSVFAARKAVTSLVDEFNWDRERIHVRTSVDTKDLFCPGRTEVSVINYGILWKCLDTGHDWTKRYGGIILDEFADLTPQRELTVRMIFDTKANG